MTGSDGWCLMLDSAVSGEGVGVGSAARSRFTDFSMGVPLSVDAQQKAKFLVI